MNDGVSKGVNDGVHKGVSDGANKNRPQGQRCPCGRCAWIVADPGAAVSISPLG